MEKLLIVFNCFGRHLFMKKQLNLYIDNIKSILWHIKENNLENQCRIIVSACCVPYYILNNIKKELCDEVTIFNYEDRYTNWVTFNKTCLYAEQYFQEKYFAYQYITSGINHPKVSDLYTRAIEKLKSNEYGMIVFQTDSDHNYQWLGHLYDYEKKIDFTKDYLIPVGCSCSMHSGFIHKSIKEFYGRPLSDTNFRGGAENSHFYVCSAIRKKYILMGDTIVNETGQFDNTNECSKPDPGPHFWHIGLLYGRTFEDTFLSDSEGLDAGLGYGCEINRVLNKEHGVLPDKYYISPKLDKYDENYLSIDDRLKWSVKRNFFTNENEVNYDQINVKVM